MESYFFFKYKKYILQKVFLITLFLTNCMILCTTSFKNKQLKRKFQLKTPLKLDFIEVGMERKGMGYRFRPCSMEFSFVQHVKI